MSDEVEPATVHAIAAIIQQCYEPWQSIAADDLEVTVISGGLCNRNYRVGLKESVVDNYTGPHAVMCRLFGEGTDDLVDRDNEQRILACAGAAGVAPRVLCSFPGGRLETLLVNCRTWGCVDLRDPFKLESMARAVGVLHRLPLPDPSAPPALPSRLRAWAAAATEAAEKLAADAAEAKAEEAAEGKGGSFEDAKESRARAVRMRRSLLCDACEPLKLAHEEVPWLLETLRERVQSPAVLCHNDLHEGNIMEALPSEPPTSPSSGNGNGSGSDNSTPPVDNGITVGRVHLVDFEFAGSNWRSFDLANALLEASIDNQVDTWPHFSIHPDAVPPPEHRRRMIRAYLTAVHTAPSSSSASSDSGPTSTTKSSDLETTGGTPSVQALASTTTAAAPQSSPPPPPPPPSTTAPASTPVAGSGLAAALAAYEPSDEEVSATEREVECCMLASHLQWTLWAIVSASEASLPFGYLEYALQRLDQYYYLKALLLEEVEAANNSAADDALVVSKGGSAYPIEAGNDACEES